MGTWRASPTHGERAVDPVEVAVPAVPAEQSLVAFVFDADPGGPFVDIPQVDGDRSIDHEVFAGGEPAQPGHTAVAIASHHR